MKKNRDTKIICTIGPASSGEKILKKMALNGMNMVRLNFSHGTHETHKKMIDLVRKVNKRSGLDIKIMQDLEGYRIRIGYFDKPKKLEPGTNIYLTKNLSGRSNYIPFDYTGNIRDIKKGYEVFIDDGQISLEVIGQSKESVKLRVVQGGILKQRKGINIPRLKVKASILTEKDKRDMQFGIDNNVDYVAQSFVRNKKDILEVSKIIKKSLPDCQIISKLENHQGVHNIDSITDACDGMIVARGDLGVSLPIYKIPMVQKYMIRRTNKKKKLSIVATQMLESMTNNSRPTRAEVTDVANAVLDGADCVMLSGETAVGRYPAETVQMMRQIIEYAESFINQKF